MTDYPINKYAHVAIDHIDTKETHIGRLIHVRGLFTLPDVNCYTFESGYQTYATEDGDPCSRLVYFTGCELLPV